MGIVANKADAQGDLFVRADMKNDVEFLLKFIANGTRVLSTRLLLLVTLLLTFGLFAWAMYDTTNLRLYTAAAFAVCVFLPILSMDKKGATDESTSNPSD